uniref:Remorin C-terminal domain-containing protein n=1 Tax=Oryza meridionalis TaxID=40149 RepID=A0A0E0ESY5_9ORYZ
MERMRCAGGDTPLGFRGVVQEELEEELAAVSASGGPMRRRRRWGEEADDGYSASSTGGGGSSGCGSFGCDSPLAGFVRADGDPDTDLETDGVATPSSNAFAEPHDEEGDEVLCGVVEGDWAQLQEPTKNPADRATGECLYQRRRSEAVLLQGRKGLKQRPASLDFGSGSPGFNGAPLSPGFVVGGVGLMNKGLVSSSFIRSDVFPSPRTPNYWRHRSSVFGYQKGWSSERVPLASKGNRRYPGSSMAFPFSNGRTLPSKWEDAERWIFSPNSSDVLEKTSFAPARRPKSKSGPLGPPGKFGGQYSSVSLLDNGRIGHLTANSPFLAGVLIPEHYCGEKDNIGRYMSRTAGEEASIGIGGKSCLANGGWSKKHVTRASSKNSTNVIEVKKKTVESKSSSWELTEAKSISKVEREQEKITAWEHLQKAKAEAAIQKLVMKIEKKRSSSLDKIWNTLRSAQRRAQVMRETAAANQDEQSSGKAKRTSHLNKNGQISSLSGCFTCHAFYFDSAMGGQEKMVPRRKENPRFQNVAKVYEIIVFLLRGSKSIECSLAHTPP